MTQREERTGTERRRLQTSVQFFSPFENMSRRLVIDLLDRTERITLSDASVVDQAEGSMDFLGLELEKDKSRLALLAFALPDGNVISALQRGDAPNLLRQALAKGKEIVAFGVQRGPREKLPPQVVRSLIPGRTEIQVEPSFMASELVWVEAEAQSAIAAEPMAHLLAAAVTDELREPSFAFDADNGHLYAFLPHDSKESSSRQICQDRHDVEFDELRAGLGDKRAYVYGRTIPKRQAFDRVVWLTRDQPRQMPERGEELLRPIYFDERTPGEPYYCSFIPTVLPDARRAVRRKFQALDLPSHLGDPDVRMPVSRIQRDTCVVAIDFEAIAAAWSKWRATAASDTPFWSFAVERDDRLRRSLARWARGVTDRRVGFALSGGGASSFRAGPVLARLEREGIEVDVFAGLSGGALLGGLYCRQGLAGIARLARYGPLLQAGLPLAMLTTRPLEMAADLILDRARVEDLEVRFAAVAVALRPDRLPIARIVTSGTIGEAMRVSGALPPSFAVTRKGGECYTDGGGGTIVPAEVARDFGADVVFACNSIPGPARCDPRPPALRILSNLVAPLAQRFVDSSAWYTYMWRHASERFGRMADVYLEFDPEDTSMAETVQFASALDIMQRVKLPQNADRIAAAVARLKDRIDKLGRSYSPRDDGSGDPGGDK